MNTGILLNANNLEAIHPISVWALRRGFYSIEENSYCLKLKKLCFKFVIDSVPKSPLVYKIELKPVNKNAIGLDELASLIQNINPMDKNFMKQYICDRIYSAGNKIRLGIKYIFSILKYIFLFLKKAYVQRDESSRPELAGMVYFYYELKEKVKSAIMIFWGVFEQYRKLGVGSTLIDYAINECQKEYEYIDYLIM